MNGQVMNWMPAILALFGSLLVMLFTAWLNTRAVIAHVDALRAEMRGDMNTMRGEMTTLRAEMRGEMSTLRAEVRSEIAELELRLTKQISELSHRVERLEEQGGRMVRP